MTRLDEIQKVVDKRTKYSKLKKMFLVVACLVVFMTTYMLILPAMTLETELICDKTEHTHDSSCYTTSKELVCEKEEKEGHSHSSSCYKTEKVLTCSDDSAEHSHSDSCYKEEKKLDCDKEECDGHKHSDSCYEEKKELTCDKEEHTHGDECYAKKEEATTQDGASEEEGTTEQAEEASTEEVKKGDFELTAQTEDEDDHAVVTLKGSYDTFDAKAEDISVSIKNIKDETADQLVMDAYGDEAVNIAQISHYNIRIKDNDKNIDPKDKISVKLEGIALGENKEKVDIYTLKDGSSNLEKVDRSLKDNGDITFDSKKFADYQYVVVTFNNPVEEVTYATELTYEDDSIKVVATLSEEAQIPDTAIFKVSKLAEGSAEYEEAEKKIQEYAEKNNITVIGHVPYDMHIEVDGQEVEPKGSVQVNVTYKKAIEVPENIEQDTNEKDDDNLIPFEVKGKSEVAAVEEEGESIKVLHLKEETKGITIEEVTQNVEVNKKEEVEEISFETDSFSTIDITKVSVSDMTTSNWISPGASTDFLTVLGNSVYYGMTVNTFHKTGHIDSTFAARLLEGEESEENITTGKYTAGEGAAGAIWIASMTGKLRIDGAPTVVYCPSEFVNTNGGGLNLQNGSYNVPVTKEAAESYIDSLMSHAIRQSEILAAQQTYTLTGSALTKLDNDKTIDLTKLKDGTYYLDGDLIMSRKRDLTIKINSGQNIVFNYSGNNVKICQFSAEIDGRRYDSANSNKGQETMATHFIFNMPNAQTVSNEGGCTGVFIAPNARYTIGSTSTGWIVCDWMSSDSGEWHFVYQNIPINIPTDVGFQATKMIDSQEPTSQEKFTFTLDELSNGKWVTIQSVNNDGKKVKFEDVQYNADGTHWYLISEVKDPSLEPVYHFSTDQYVEKVVVTHKTVGNTTTYSRYITKYKVDPNKKLLVDNQVNTAALIEIFSDNDIVFVNRRNDDTSGNTSIKVEKKWYENDIDITDTIEHAPISFKLIQISSTGNEVQYPNANKTYSISKENNWKNTIFNLPKTGDGDITYTYKVEEIDPDPDYTVTYSNNNGVLEGTIEIINTYNKTSIDMKKVWVGVDADNTPASITFGVYNGTANEPVATFVLTKDGVSGGTSTIQASHTADWAAKVTGLPVLTSGSYSVKELYIGQDPATAVTEKEDGTAEAGAYKVTYSTEDGVLVITNTKDSEYTLPEAGGMGTTPFTFSGLALLGLAGGMILYKKRKVEE